VLVDWGLVLTAGHCARLYALADFAVVFGYYYAAPGVLLADGETRQPTKVVAAALDPAGAAPRRDFAWLRLDRPVAPPRQPVAIHVGPTMLQVGDPLVAAGAGGGVPITADYIFADTDTGHGSSGGAAFDFADGASRDVARGRDDFAVTASGCNQTIHAPGGADDAGEEFSYSQLAFAGLCAQGRGSAPLRRAGPPASEASRA
jgi:hypothetical protein